MKFLKEFKGNFDLKDVLLLASVPLILTLVFLSPLNLKKRLVFDYKNPTALTAFTTHFVHYTSKHFLGNLGSYFFFVIPTYFMGLLGDWKKNFYITFLIFILLFPFIISFVNLKFLKPYLDSEMGFSGINSAFLGLVPVSLFAFWKHKFNENLKLSDSLILFIVGLWEILFFYASSPLSLVPALGIIILLIFLFYRMWDRLEIEDIWDSLDGFIREKGYFGLSLFVALFFVASFFNVFPRDLTSDGSFINILSHYWGFLFGFPVSYLIFGVTGWEVLRSLKAKIKEFFTKYKFLSKPLLFLNFSVLLSVPLFNSHTLKELNSLLNVFIPTVATVFSVFLGLPFLLMEMVSSKFESNIFDYFFDCEIKSLMTFSAFVISFLFMLKTFSSPFPTIAFYTVFTLSLTQVLWSTLSFYETKDKVKTKSVIDHYYNRMLESKSSEAREDNFKKLFSTIRKAVTFNEEYAYRYGLKKLFKAYTEELPPGGVRNMIENRLGELPEIAEKRVVRISIIKKLGEILVSGLESKEVLNKEEIKEKMKFYFKGAYHFSVHNSEYLGIYLSYYRELIVQVREKENREEVMDAIFKNLVREIPNNLPLVISKYFRELSDIMYSNEINKEVLGLFEDRLGNLNVEENRLNSRKASLLKKGFHKLISTSIRKGYYTLVPKANLAFMNFLLDTNRIDRKIFSTGALYFSDFVSYEIQKFKDEEKVGKLDKIFNVMRSTLKFGYRFVRDILLRPGYYDVSLYGFKDHIGYFKDLISPFTGSIRRDKGEKYFKELKILSLGYLGELLQISYLQVKRRNLSKEALRLFIFGTLSNYNEEISKLMKSPTDPISKWEMRMFPTSARGFTGIPFKRPMLYLHFFLNEMRKGENLEEVIPSPEEELEDFFREALEVINNSKFEENLKLIEEETVSDTELYKLKEVIKKRPDEIKS